MSNNTENASSDISKSSQKRAQRKKEVASAKKKAVASKLVGIVIGAAIVLLIVGSIGLAIYYSVTATKSNNQFSAYLSDEGFIQDADMSKVTPIDFKNVTVPLADVDFTDDEVTSAINATLEENAEYSTDEKLVVADGDSVNIDYIGSIDGIAFEGGNTQGNGKNVTIGSGSLIDDFEQQLIGSHPGDSLTVKVNFPEDYTSQPSFSGKEASFEVVVNSKKVTPELTDAFVKEKFADVASTVDEYRAYVKENGYQTKLDTYLKTYLNENSAVSAYPGDYLKQARCLIKYTDEQTYTNYNNYFYSYYGYMLYESFEDFIGMSDHDYEAKLKKDSKIQVAVDMTYEYIFKNAGLTVSDEAYQEVLKTYGETGETSFGKPYLMQRALKNEVLKYIKTLVTVQ